MHTRTMSSVSSFYLRMSQNADKDLATVQMYFYFYFLFPFLFIITSNYSACDMGIPSPNIRHLSEALLHSSFDV